MNEHLKSNIYHLKSCISLTADRQPPTALLQQTLQQRTPAPPLQNPNGTKGMSDIDEIAAICANFREF